MQIIQQPILPEKSVKCVYHVGPVIRPIVKPTLSEIVPDCVKQVPGTEHVITKPKFIISRQEKPPYADLIYRPPQNKSNHPHKYIQKKQKP